MIKLTSLKNIDFWFCLFISAVVFLIYFPVLGHQFITIWDDQWVVMNGYTEAGINMTNIRNILIDFYHGQYSPMNEFFYLFLYAIDGYNPFYFHLASLLLHIANVILVYFVLKEIVSLSVKIITPFGREIAFLTALLFGIHPMNVESVAWMSASKILVYAFFYLCATFVYLYHIKTGKEKYYFISLLLFVLSFLGKEQAVTFPVLLILLYWLSGEKLTSQTTVIKVLPFFCLSLVFGLITIQSQFVIHNHVHEHDTYSFLERIVLASYAAFEYFIKVLLPYKLLYIYPFPWTAGSSMPSWLLFYPFSIVTMIVTFRKYLIRPVNLFVFTFFLIHIGVALHIISISRFTVVADRYVYVSSIGALFFVSYYLVNWGMKPLKRVRRIAISSMFIFILYTGIYTHQRSKVWYDGDTLKKEVRELLQLR